MADVTYVIALRDKVTATAKKIQGSLKGIQKQSEKVANSFDMMGIAAAGVAAAGVFKLGADLEKTTILFNTMTGSVEKGTKLFEGLTEFANATPFSNQALNKNAQTLLAFGEEAESITNTLRMLGDVSAGDEQKLNQLTLAFAQIKSTGKLMGQDLLQLINAGFNPLQIISEKTGRSMGDLKDAMSKGQISADLVAKAFQSATGPGGRFFQLTEKMSQSMAGKWSTVMGKGKFVIAEFGLSLKEVFLPILDKVIGMIDKVSKFMKRNSSAIKFWGGALINFLPILVSVIGAMKLFNAVASMNPYVLIVVAIAAVVAIMVRLYQTSGRVRGSFYATWEAIKIGGKIIWKLIKMYLTPLIMMWKYVMQVGSKVTSFFSDKFKSAMEDASDSTGFLAKSWEKLKTVFISVSKYILSAVGHIVKSFDALLKGDFEKAGMEAKKALENMFGKGDIDINFATNAAKQIADAYKRGMAEVKKVTANGGGAMPGFDMAMAGGAIGLSDDAKKIQAEGIVAGGGIKTFNINIQSLTGVQSLTTNNIEGGAERAGRSIVDELLTVLADIKSV